MTSLICGSLAYDTIMTFDGQFSEVILPDQLHNLNAAFLVPSMRREFGGCAGNIAYNLKLLGGDPLIMATIGQDGAAYLERLAGQEIRTDCIRLVPDAFTAQAFITTDASNHQLTAFHPGAMMSSHLNQVEQAGKVDIAIIAPDGREGMLQHAKDCAKREIPFIFDPGQGLPMFNGEELLQLIEFATYVTLNDYEAALLVDRTGKRLEEIADGLTALIVTHSSAGSQIHTGGKIIDIPSAKAGQVVDPTGCGDAYRAGLLHGLSRGMDWETTGRLASLMGAMKIECQGGQNHLAGRETVQERFAEAFGYSISLS
jgi:adenosine kinase